MTSQQPDTATSNNTSDPANSNNATEEVIHPNFYWDGNMPMPSGIISSEFAKSPVETQLKQTNELAEFLMKNHTDNFNQLNSDKTLIPFIIHSPRHHRCVRLIYGLATGFVINGIKPTPLEDNILALQGEYIPNNQSPQVVTLSYDTLSRISVKLPTMENFQNELGKRENEKKNYWSEARNLPLERDVFFAVPIPAYIAYDAFECNFQTNLLFERIRYHQEMDDYNYWAPLAKDFLMAGKAKHVAARREQTLRIHINQFTGYPLPDALKWKEQRLAFLFPTIFGPGSCPQQENIPPATNIQAPQNNKNLTPNTIAAIIKALRQEDNLAIPTNYTSSATATKSSDESSEKSNPAHKVGLATSAFNKLMTMCSLKPGQEDEIPQLWKDLADKELQKNDRQSIVIDALTSKAIYDDVRVPPLLTIITMIHSRNFEGSDTSSSLTSTARGLSPFAVPLITDSKVKECNEHHQALQDATLTTVQDLQQKKLVASAPSLFDKMIKQLKIYANLLFCIFDDSCPLLQQVKEDITNLNLYSPQAKASTTPKTRASILWITMLQSRHFAAGKMDGPKGVLAAFTHMSNNIKTLSLVEHGDVPPSLYNPTPSTKTVTFNLPPSTSNQNKRHADNNYHSNNNKRANRGLTKEEVKAFYHPIIKEAFRPLADLKPCPYISTICKAANIASGDLFPNHPKLCLKAQLWGTCKPNCEHEHKKVSDNKAKEMINKVQSVLNDPSSLKNKV